MIAPLCLSSVCARLVRLLLRQLERCRVDAVAHARRLWAIVEQVAEVRAALAAVNLGT